MGFPKRLLGDDETLVLSLRPHVKVLFVPVLVLLVVAPVASLLVGVMPEGFAQVWLRGAVAVVAALILLRWTVWPFVVWWNTMYAVTTRRLVIREGVFAREGHDMPLTRLNDVSFSHSFWERLLGCGTLVIESAGENGQIELEDIPRIEQVQRTLYRLSDDVRAGDRDRVGASARDADPDLRTRGELPDEQTEEGQTGGQTGDGQTGDGQTGDRTVDLSSGDSEGHGSR